MVGFYIENINTIESVYKCPHCELLLRDAVQIIDCGHRLCQSCLDDQLGDVITCSECQQKTPRESIKPDRGFRKDTQKLSITCSLCEWSGILKNYQNHLDDAHANPTCAYCEQKFRSVNDLNRHQKYNCDMIPIDCPLKPMGCEETFARGDAANHYLTNRHQNVLNNIVRQKFKIPQHPATNVTVDQYESINETINVLLDSIEVLSNDLQRIGTESGRSQNMLQPIIHDLPNIKKSSAEQNAFVDNMKKTQEIHENEIPSAKQQLENIKSAKHDGTLIWKITDVKDKRVVWKSNKQATIDSPPFYSSSTGYKMCLRLTLNGDGNGRDTYTSLSFALMCNDYDAILTFPFCFKMIFCLYDLSGQQQNIIDVVVPDTKLEAFRRPQSDIKFTCVLPKFIPLAVLQKENSPYIHEDTIYIKAMIDYFGIPLELLPYALSLSPGFTLPVQQEMIDQETENRKEQQALASAMSKSESNQSMDIDSKETKTRSNISSNKKNRQNDSNNGSKNRTKKS